MKVLLVPWVNSFSFLSLRIYKLDGGKIRLNDCVAEIRTLKGQKIALTLIQRNAESIRLSVSDFLKSFRMVAEADIPDSLGERLLFALKYLERVKYSNLILQELMENPTLEDLEKFLFLRKLLE